MTQLYLRFEAVTRTVVIPMLHEIKNFSSSEKNDVQRGKECASRYLPNILNISDTEFEDLKIRAYSLREKIADAMPDVTDSNQRIAENYGMLIAATELVSPKQKSVTQFFSHFCSYIFYTMCVKIS